MSDTGALVYVVDDDASAREGVAGLIRSAGLMAKTFASGEEFLAAPRPKMPSCLVLDVNLPGLNGLELQRELAKSGVQVPIIFLTGHGDIPMTVRALKAGAANFLTKPFDDKELLNAIRQCTKSAAAFQPGIGDRIKRQSLVTRRDVLAGATTKVFPPFRLDTINQCLWRRGEAGQDERILLTPKAFAVLRYLVEHAGRLVTQEELLDAVWPDTFVQPEVLKYQIADIRSILGDNPKDPVFIETLPRRGYRFAAAVRDSGDAESPSSMDKVPGRLVGRARELGELRTCLEKALRGQHQIVFVTGESGIGKTALVDEFQRQAAAERPSLRIAHGQCVEGYGGTEAYYPMLEALGQLCRGPEGDRVVEILASHAPTWLVQFPSLLKREQRQALQQEILGATRDRMLREIRDALDTLNLEAPLLLVFEDLQWVDASTADLISALARQRTRARSMVIITERPVGMETGDHPLKRAKQELLAHYLCQEIALEPLSQAQVAEHLSGESGESLPEGFAELIYRYSEGNPLFMIAALDHMTEHGSIAREGGRWRLRVPLQEIDLGVPETLRHMIEAHIDHLTIEEQRVLEVASVAGVRFPANAVTAALQQAPEFVEEILEKLSRRSHIVHAAGAKQLAAGSISQVFEFVHAAYREVFYGRLTPVRRAWIRRRIDDSVSQPWRGVEETTASHLAERSGCSDLVLQTASEACVDTAALALA
jgi:DNA-binding response OmpR family regulator